MFQPFIMILNLMLSKLHISLIGFNSGRAREYFISLAGVNLWYFISLEGVNLWIAWIAWFHFTPVGHWSKGELFTEYIRLRQHVQRHWCCHPTQNSKRDDIDPQMHGDQALFNLHSPLPMTQTELNNECGCVPASKKQKNGWGCACQHQTTPMEYNLQFEHLN